MLKLLVKIIVLYTLILISYSRLPTTYNDFYARHKLWPMAQIFGNLTKPNQFDNKTHDENYMSECFSSSEFYTGIIVPCDIIGNNTNITCSGALGVSHDEEAIILMFRGTNTNAESDEENIFANITTTFPGGGTVHKFWYEGFLSTWKAGLSNAFFSAKNKYPTYELWTVGWSMGGSMAAISAGYISQLGYIPKDQIKLVTFGQPRIGFADLAARFPSLVPYTYRVTHHLDYVPHTPPTELGYVHFKNEGFSQFDNHNPLYLSAQAFLLLLSLLNIAWFISVAIILRKNRLFHINLITLICSMFIAVTIYLVCRMILIIETFICAKECYDTNPFMFSRSLFYVDFIRLTAGGAYLSTMNFIIVERFHATIELSTYEKKIHYRFIVNAIFWQYLAGFWFAIMLYKEILSMMVILPVSEIWCAVFGIAYYLFDRINQKRYKNSTTNGNSYTLSERYQLAENIKTASLMKNSIISFAIFNANILMMYTLVWWLEDSTSKKWAQFIYEIEISIFMFLLPIIATMSCDTWKGIFIKEFNKIHPINPSEANQSFAIGEIPIENLNHVKSSKGEKIIFKLDQEGEIYFDQLKKSWD